MPGPVTQVLQPSSHASASGRVILTVDPEERYGGGKADYRLTRDGCEVWSGRRPFSLWEAAVAEDGTVVGCVYTGGRGRMPQFPAGGSTFDVVILAPNGVALLHDRTPLVEPRVLEGWAGPWSEGLLLQEVRDRCIVRIRDWVGNRREESWRVYQLSTGKRLPDLDPWRGLTVWLGERRWLDGAWAIPGTPLLLLQFRCECHPLGPLWPIVRALRPKGGPEPSNSGLYLVLQNPDRGAVWILHLRGDHSMLEVDREGRSLLFRILLSGVCRLGSQPGSFHVWSLARWEETTYQVRRRWWGWWSVRAVERHTRRWQVPVPPPPLTVPHLAYETMAMTPLLRSQNNELSIHSRTRPRYGALVATHLPEGLRLWWLEPGRGIMMLDPELGMLWRAERHPDRQWLRWVHHLAVAPDGRCAALTSSWQGESLRYLVTLYDVHGSPLRSVALSFGASLNRIAWNGEWMAVAGSSQLVLLDKDGTPLAQAKFPGEHITFGESEAVRLFFSEDGRELYLTRVREGVLKFALPERTEA